MADKHWGDKTMDILLIVVAIWFVIGGAIVSWKVFVWCLEALGILLGLFVCLPLVTLAFLLVIAAVDAIFY